MSMAMSALRLTACIAVVVLLISQRPDAQFRTTADLVVLNVRVTDRDGRHVAGLTARDFTVFDDGRAQPASVFVDEDAPVTVGLIVDSSTSMWAITDRLIAGATAFAAASHPENELFAIAFNDLRWPALPPAAPFTSDPDVFGEGLARVLQPRGRTALFDAINAGLAYAARGTRSRKALVVLSDGGDNASRTTLKDVLWKTQGSNVVVYGVVIADPLEPDAKPEVLRELACASGGEALAPRTVDDVGRALGHIAEDIRRSYTIGYMPTRGAPGARHALRVVVSSAGHRGLRVRTRAEYREATAEERVHVDR
jgi:Ca-activated chloride channel family protein